MTARRAVLPAAQVLIGAGLACLVGWLLWRMSRGGAAWTDRQRLAVIAGDFSIFILFLPGIEFRSGEAKRGVTAVALAALIFLLVLWRRVWRRTAACRQEILGGNQVDS